MVEKSPIYKNGDTADCQNYKKMTIRNVMNRTLAMIIEKETSGGRNNFGNYNHWFRGNRRVIGHISTSKKNV